MNRLTQNILSKNHAILPFDISAPNTIPPFKDLLIKIFLNLNTEDTLSCALTCKRFYSIARSDPIMNRLFYVRFFPTREATLNPLQLNGVGKQLWKLFQLKKNLKKGLCQEKNIHPKTQSKAVVDHFILFERKNNCYDVFDIKTLKRRTLTGETSHFLGSTGVNAFFYFYRERKQKIFNLEKQTSYDLPKDTHFNKINLDSFYFYTIKIEEGILTFDFWNPQKISFEEKIEPMLGFSIDARNNLLTAYGLDEKYFYIYVRLTNLVNTLSNFYVTVWNIETGDYFDISDKGNFPVTHWPNLHDRLTPYAYFYKDCLLSNYDREIRRWDMKEKRWLEPIDIGETILKWSIDDDYLFALIKLTAKIVDINTRKLLYSIECMPFLYTLSLENGYFIEKKEDRIYFLNIKTGKKTHFISPSSAKIIIDKIKVMHSLCFIPLSMEVKQFVIIDIDRASIDYASTLYSEQTSDTEVYLYEDNLVTIDNDKLKIFNSNE